MEIGLNMDLGVLEAQDRIRFLRIKDLYPDLAFLRFDQIGPVQSVIKGDLRSQ